MANGLRVALPGYDALTETDLDKFSLYTGDSDSDPVLIKEFTRGEDTIDQNDGAPAYEITHNLGYIPFFIVYALNPGTSKWELVAHFQSALSVPNYSANADTSKLYISNFTSSTQFRWIIFYDNVVGNSNITLNESRSVIKLPRKGYDALTDKDPNHMIFHSDLNTMKILKEGSVDITGTGSGSYSFNHNSPVDAETAFLIYCKFPDGTTALIPGGYGASSKNDDTQFVTDLHITSTQFVFNLGSGTGTYSFKYYILDASLGSAYDFTTPVDVTTLGNRIVVAKDGYDVRTELNPDNLRFDSRFNTLKYNVEGNQTVSVSGNNEDKTTEVTITNTWGGVKAFIVYVNGIFASQSSLYAIAPHLSNTLTLKHEATAHMDEFSLYLKLRVKETSSFSYSANFYYKIFANDLGF